MPTSAITLGVVTLDGRAIFTKATSGLSRGWHVAHHL